MSIGSNKGVDGIAIQIFEITQIDNDIAHVIFDQKSNGVFKLRGIKNLGVAQTC